MKNITIYGQRNCKYCTLAIQFCQDAKLPFVYLDIVDRKIRDTMFRLNPKAKTVPQIFVGVHLIGGFDDLSRLDPFQLQQMIGE